MVLKTMVSLQILKDGKNQPIMQRQIMLMWEQQRATKMGFTGRVLLIRGIIHMFILSMSMDN